MMGYEASVVIPTRNPRPDFIEQVLGGLKRQTLDYSKWELLIVDNGSKKPLKESIDIGWHPHSKHLLENEPGLTPTRVKGIQESLSNLIVFVDDDNILDADYLEQAVGISNDRPYLGVWSGNVKAEFEETPPKELEPYLWCLCIREVSRDIWGNSGDITLMPWGAGMCVRKKVGLDYCKRISESKINSLIGRATGLPRGGNDYDVAATSFESGMGVGLFQKLNVKHLMPKERTTFSNIIMMNEKGAAASVVYNAVHGISEKESSGFIDKMVKQYKYFRGSKFQRSIADAIERGKKEGKRLIQEAQQSLPMEK